MDAKIEKNQDKKIEAGRLSTEEKHSQKLSGKEQGLNKEKDSLSALGKNASRIPKDPLSEPMKLIVPELNVQKSGASKQDVLPAFSFRQNGQDREGAGHEKRSEKAVLINHASLLKNAANEVRNSKRRFFDDSWRMKLIKSNIDKLTILHSRKITADTDLTALQANAMDIYGELVRSCEEYIKARSSGKEAEDSRHGKVRALLNTARTGLVQVSSLRQEDISVLVSDDRMDFGALLEKDALVRALDTEETRNREIEALSRARARSHYGLVSFQNDFKDDSALSVSLQKYLGLQSGYLPKDKDGFDKKRESLIKACEDAVREAEKISKEGAFLERKKVRRDKANQLLSQLRWELFRLNKAAFKAQEKGSLLTWDSIWDGDKLVLLSTQVSKTSLTSFHYKDEILKLKDKFYRKEAERELAPEFAGIEGKKSSDGVKGTALMARLLGVPELFSCYKEVTIVVPEQQENINKAGHEDFEGDSAEGYIAGDAGITLSEALEKARKLDVNLVYTDEAIKKLTTIQIMDTICGQVNRDEGGIKVFTKTGSKGGENYLFIKDVYASNNEYSFGTADFKTVNKTGEQSTLKKLWEEKQNRLAINIYDTAFADRILSLDENELKQTFLDAGFQAETVEALADRFQGVKEALDADKKDKTSIRSRYEAVKADKGLSEEERKKKLAIYPPIYSVQFQMGYGVNTYVNSSLIWKYGDVEEYSLNDSVHVREEKTGKKGRNTDDTLNSVKLRKEHLKKCDLLVEEDIKSLLNNYSSSEHYEIMTLATLYTRLDATGEKGVALYEEGIKTEEYLDSLLGFQIEENLKNRLIGMRPEDALSFLESYIVKELKLKLSSRITALSQSDTKEAEAELSMLKRYDELFSGFDGELDAPAKIHADEAKFTLLDKHDKPIQKNDLKDLNEHILFAHPPCIQDVLQGGLGDCYFIAALGAVVENDPSFIKKSMLDNHDGTVTVRLFKNKKPFYVRVKKTIKQNSRGKTEYSRGSLWVQMYEKAYMVSGIRKDELMGDELRKFKAQEKQGQRSFGSIVAGSSKYALEALTGSSGKHFFIDTDLESQNRIAQTEKDRRVLTDEGMLEYEGDMESIIRKTLEALKKAKQDNKLVTVGSRNEFIQQTKGAIGEIEGEESGLFSQHAYTVLGIEEENGVTRVRLRNPWSMGRAEAVRNPVSGKITYRKASITSMGSFVVDMETFVTYFSDIYTTSHSKFA